jgi:cytochrome c oxidase subunit 4
MRDGSQHGGPVHVLPLKTYLAVFAALLVGTALTTWIATVDLGRLNDAVALGIACTKAALVLLYFMHLRYAIRMVWVFALAGLVWLAILFVITLSDYETRVLVEGWAG